MNFTNGQPPARIFYLATTNIFSLSLNMDYNACTRILSERWAREKNLIEFEFHRTNNDQQRNELTMIQRAIIAEYKYCKRIKANPTKFIEHKNDILGKRSTSLYRSENRFINEIIPKSVSFLSICFFLSLPRRTYVTYFSLSNSIYSDCSSHFFHSLVRHY